MQIYSLIASFLYVAPVVIALIITFRDHIKTPKYWGMGAGIFLFMSVCLFFSHVYFTQPITNNVTTVFTIICMFAATVIFNSTCDFDFMQSAFIVFICKCYTDNLHLLSTIVHYLFTGKGPRPLGLSYVIVTIVLNILCFPLVYLFFRKLLKPVLEETKLFSFWKLFSSLPVLAALLYSIMIFPEFETKLPEDPVQLFTIPVAWIFLSTLVYVVLLLTTAETTKNAKLSEELHLAEFALSTQEKQMEMFQNKIDETRRLRHDFRHTLTALQSYLQKEDYAQMDAYLNRYISQLENATPILYTSNMIINSIVSYYVQQCADNGIETTVRIQISDRVSFPDIDLCVVLGNLLENAYEACMRQTSENRFIRLKISSRHDTTLVLVLENSYDGTIRQKKDSFLSSKQQGRIGIGISSVRQVTEKYGGIANFEHENGIFKASVLLSERIADPS